MHDAVYEFVGRCVVDVDFTEKRVLEIGSKNVNGTVKPLFGSAFYFGIDALPGKDVDFVIDAKDFKEQAFGQNGFDFCVSVEALEHCPNPQDIIDCAYSSLKSGGVFIVTAAAPNRVPHRADGEVGDPVENGEFYANVDPQELEDWLWATGFVNIEVAQVGDGVQGTALKP
jgi:SAM-dependent methyltransferase